LNYTTPLLTISGEADVGIGMTPAVESTYRRLYVSGKDNTHTGRIGAISLDASIEWNINGHTNTQFYSTQPVMFYVNGDTRMTIKSTGDVVIGAVANIMADGHGCMPCSATAMADADMFNNTVSWYANSGETALYFKYKTAAGAVKTSAAIAIS
jgi:hypothetical protein